MSFKTNFWTDCFDSMIFPKAIDQPILEEDFRNPYSNTVKNIFFIYSLESFLYSRLNWAARDK